MSDIHPKIFRAYDIRGKAYDELTKEGCVSIGLEFGLILKECYGIDSPKVVVGLDARTHGPVFHTAVIDGLLSAGCSVLDIGLTPSPVNYFTICSQKLDGGIQVTASHNPKEDNGLKLQTREARAFCGEDIQRLRLSIQNKTYKMKHSPSSGTKTFDAITPYINHLSRMFAGIGNGQHVTIDCGNGAAGPTYTQILKNIGCALKELYTKPDGEFPNHQADPSQYHTLHDLKTTVRDAKSSIGLAFDGDGDRLGIVDETGTIRTADEILLLLAKDHLKRHKDASIVFTVSSSGILSTEIKRWGGYPVMEKVGHSFVEHAMEEHGSLLGGEQSGHFFCFEDYYHFDDALMAGLRILKIVRESAQPASTLFNAFPKVYQSIEKRPHCPDESKTETVQKITEHFASAYPVITIDGVRIDFGDGAWAGIRQSNTSPCLSVCIEARSPKKLEEVEQTVWDHLREYPHILI